MFYIFIERIIVDVTLQHIFLIHFITDFLKIIIILLQSKSSKIYQKNKNKKQTNALYVLTETRILLKVRYRFDHVKQ